MLRTALFLICAVILVVLAMPSKAQAWGCYHYSYHRSGGYGGGGGYHYGGSHYGGGSAHYGYSRRW